MFVTTAVLGAVLSGAPFPHISLPNLLPRMQLVAPPTNLLVVASPRAPEEEHDFSVPWLVAGAGGGVLSGLLFGTAIAGRCGRQSGGSAGAGIAVGALWAVGGTLLGWGAGSGSTPAKVAVVGVDIIGPSVGALAHGCP